MVGVMTPALLGIAGVTVDAGFWLIGQTRLQVAADAGAMGASYLLSSATFKAMSAATQTSTMQSVVLFEAQAAATKLAGTLTTPVTVSFSTTGTTPYATVTLTSQMNSYFFGAFGISAPLVRATAKASLVSSGGGSSNACVLALATSGVGIQVDNSGTLTAASCTITSDSAGSPSIYLNTGTITATSINAVGTVTQSNSGGNSMTPTSGTTVSAVSDPNSAKTAPAAGTCTAHADYTAYSSTTYVANPATWCGNTIIGGNGSSIQFNPGIYYISGDLTFNNAIITSASGVTFVVTGNLAWTNYSNTTTQITAPTSGATSGIVFWQPCAASQTSSFQGGSTLALTGTIYAPCSVVDVGNNAQINAPLNSSMNVIVKTLYVHGSAAVRASTSGGGGSTTAALTQ